MPIDILWPYLCTLWLMGFGPGQATINELERLEGHQVRVYASGDYRIEDVAGEGPAYIGHVERRGKELWLRTGKDQAYLLRGPLARPRIAGPGYKVWVVGQLDDTTTPAILHPRRLGILASPWRTQH